MELEQTQEQTVKEKGTIQVSQVKIRENLNKLSSRIDALER